jgi:Ca2+-binding EF-hand superfamily protein
VKWTKFSVISVRLQHLFVFNGPDQSFLSIDRDKSGNVDVDEFLIGIKGDLNERRRSFVQMAFDILDVDRSGEISIDEMMSKYDFRSNPDVVAGRKTIKQAAKEFMSHWEKDGDETITYDEFEDYYKGISASIDTDDYFELMIRNAWRIAGGKGAAANTANRRVLVTNKDGSQAVKTVENELGMKDWKDQNEVRRRLGQNQLDRVNMDDIDRMDMHGANEDQKNSRYRDNGAKARTTQLEVSQVSFSTRFIRYSFFFL